MEFVFLFPIFEWIKIGVFFEGVCLSFSVFVIYVLNTVLVSSMMRYLQGGCANQCYVSVEGTEVMEPLLSVLNYVGSQGLRAQDRKGQTLLTSCKQRLRYWTLLSILPLNERKNATSNRTLVQRKATQKCTFQNRAAQRKRMGKRLVVVFFLKCLLILFLRLDELLALLL